MVEAERKKDQRKGNLEDLSFEDALAELEEIVRQLEQGRGTCLLYTSPSPRDRQKSRMPSSA